MSSSRPSRSTSPRTTALVAPERTSTSPGAPRNDDSVERKPTASSSAVLPAPLGPTTTVSPAGSSRSVDAWLRKSVSQRRRSRTGTRSRHPDGHQEVEELLAADRLDQRRLEGV